MKAEEVGSNCVFCESSCCSYCSHDFNVKDLWEVAVGLIGCTSITSIPKQSLMACKVIQPHTLQSKSTGFQLKSSSIMKGKRLHNRYISPTVTNQGRWCLQLLICAQYYVHEAIILQLPIRTKIQAMWQEEKQLLWKVNKIRNTLNGVRKQRPQDDAFINLNTNKRTAS